MKTRTKFLLAAGAVAMLSLGGLAGLAQADMEGGMGAGMGGGRCGMGHGMANGMMGHGKMGRQMMQRFDADKDGKVTQAEVDKTRADALAEGDADKNGTLSLEEFKVLWLKSRNEMMVREFQFFDSDGNGQVTIEEYKAPTASIVADRDQNDDGALGPDDRQGQGMMRQGHGKQGHGKQGHDNQGHGRKGHGMMGMGQGMGEGHGMMGGNGPCMNDGDEPGQADDAPGEEPAAP